MGVQGDLKERARERREEKKRARQKAKVKEKAKKEREKASQERMERLKNMTPEERWITVKESTNNAVGACVSATGIIIGAVMLGLGKTMGDKCKMRCIDISNYDDESAPGNIPKWFILTGTVFMIWGGIGCCTVGPFPECLREFSFVTMVFADLIGGLFGKILFMVGWVAVSICNLIGFFWYWMAATARYPENSREEGDPNYCDPIMWNTMWLIIHGFGGATAFLCVTVGAGIHKFIRGDAALLELQTDKGGNPVNTPKKKHGQRGAEAGVPV